MEEGRKEEERRVEPGLNQGSKSESAQAQNERAHRSPLAGIQSASFSVLLLLALCSALSAQVLVVATTLPAAFNCTHVLPQPLQLRNYIFSLRKSPFALHSTHCVPAPRAISFPTSGVCLTLLATQYVQRFPPPPPPSLRL